MHDLIKLLKLLREAENAYKVAKTSLDGSTALITAKQELKEARYNWLKECESHILEHVLKENPENVYE